MQAHGRKSTPNRAYSYSNRCTAGTKTHRAFRGSGVGKFHDGIDYRFFNNRDTPEMPAEVYVAKRASPSERIVRQRLSSSPRGTNAAKDTRGDQGEEGEAENIDWESGAEWIAPKVHDKTTTPGQQSEPFPKAATAPAEGKGADSTVPLTTIETAAQTIDGGDGGGSGGVDGRNNVIPESGDGHNDDEKTSPTAVSLPSPTSTHRSSELIGWSELLMIDLVLAYFRYYARRRTGYDGRTFCHRSQVRASAGFCAFLVLENRAPPIPHCPQLDRQFYIRKAESLARLDSRDHAFLL